MKFLPHSYFYPSTNIPSAIILGIMLLFATFNPANGCQRTQPRDIKSAPPDIIKQMDRDLAYSGVADLLKMFIEPIVTNPTSVNFPLSPAKHKLYDNNNNINVGIDSSFSHAKSHDGNTIISTTAKPLNKSPKTKFKDTSLGSYKNRSSPHHQLTQEELNNAINDSLKGIHMYEPDLFGIQNAHILQDFYIISNNSNQNIPLYVVLEEALKLRTKSNTTLHQHPKNGTNILQEIEVLSLTKCNNNTSKHPCGSNAQCINGVCKCIPPFFGTNCQYYIGQIKGEIKKASVASGILVAFLLALTFSLGSYLFVQRKRRATNMKLATSLLSQAANDGDSFNPKYSTQYDKITGTNTLNTNNGMDASVDYESMLENMARNVYSRNPLLYHLYRTPASSLIPRPKIDTSSVVTENLTTNPTTKSPPTDLNSPSSIVSPNSVATTFFAGSTHGDDRRDEIDSPQSTAQIQNNQNTGVNDIFAFPVTTRIEMLAYNQIIQQPKPEKERLFYGRSEKKSALPNQKVSPTTHDSETREVTQIHRIRKMDGSQKSVVLTLNLSVEQIPDAQDKKNTKQNMEDYIRYSQNTDLDDYYGRYMPNALDESRLIPRAHFKGPGAQPLSSHNNINNTKNTKTENIETYKPFQDTLPDLIKSIYLLKYKNLMINEEQLPQPNNYYNNLSPNVTVRSNNTEETSLLLASLAKNKQSNVPSIP